MASAIPVKPAAAVEDVKPVVDQKAQAKKEPKAETAAAPNYKSANGAPVGSHAATRKDY